MKHPLESQASLQGLWSNPDFWDVREQPPDECIVTITTPHSRIVRSEKYCPRCQKTKKASEFYRANRTCDGLFGYCIACAHAHQRERYKRNGKSEEKWAREKALSLKRRYNLSQEEYDEMYQAQGGMCAACGQSETKLDGRSKQQIQKLAVDHDHRTGQVRGLLCNGCNVALGHLNDNIERIRALEQYLLKH